MSRALIAAVAIAAAPASAEGWFSTAIDDLPLAPGLVETGPGLWFDDANGQILGVVANGSADPSVVLRFYLDTLPALGWSLSPGAGVDGELVFLRNRERLTLMISRRAQGTELKLRLFVRPAPSRDD